MSDEFELSRRKILGALGTVGVASAGAGIGTSAYFNDTESFENNSLTAGELDLRVDWQQAYRNGAAGTRDGPDYVNAHPDHDGDRIQSLNSDDYSSIPDDGVVQYTDNGRNIQEYLTCETLENHTETSFGDQDHLVALDDVKPGDSGEITFSLHLCDNPACLWLQAGNLSAGENGQNEAERADGDGESSDSTSRGDGELIDELQVRAWYDLDCDNVYEEGESKIFAWGTLDEFMNQVSGRGRQLNPLQYGIAGVNPAVATTSESLCLKLGKLEFTGSDQDQITIDDDSDGEIVGEDSDDDDDDVEDQRYRLEDTANDEWAIIDITGFERKESGEVIGFYFEVDEVSSPGIGICQVDVKGGGSQGGGATTESYTFGGYCVPGNEGNGPALYAPIGPGGSQSGVSNAVFYYCTPDIDIPIQETFLCFPANETFCVGFEWFLPTDVGNEIQSDSVSFDLGFYTEQARHNDDPGQTI